MKRRSPPKKSCPYCGDGFDGTLQRHLHDTRCDMFAFIQQQHARGAVAIRFDSAPVGLSVADQLDAAGYGPDKGPIAAGCITKGPVDYSHRDGGTAHVIEGYWVHGSAIEIVKLLEVLNNVAWEHLISLAANDGHVNIKRATEARPVAHRRVLDFVREHLAADRTHTPEGDAVLAVFDALWYAPHDEAGDLRRQLLAIVHTALGLDEDEVQA
jgi:hypothetical protein